MHNNSQAFPSGKYMNSQQLAWFRAELQYQLDQCERSIASLKDMELPSVPEGDEADIADYKIQIAQQGAVAQHLHQSKLELVAALERIESGDFGYCEDTGDEIGLPRLKAKPTARLCIDAQERRERQERFQA